MLEGKVAVITGAGSGIGQATALLFARRGVSTIIADILVEEGGRYRSLDPRFRRKSVFCQDRCIHFQRC
jgi:NAD(P)-dependent dehydrogenase (short-subunit alcohol dehydrogenase family)